MKTSKNSFQCRRLLQAAAVAFSILSVTGCSMMGFQRTGKNDAAADSLEAAAAELQAENRALDATVNAMNSLVNKPSADLKPQFERFSAALDRLVALQKRNERAAERVSRKSTDYFKNWDEELTTISYGSIRNQSVSRKTQVNEEFNTVNRRYRETQAVVQPVIVYFEDIRTALRADLTDGGLNAVKEIAANAEKNSRKVQVALGRAADELAASGARMSSIVSRPTDSSRGEMAEGGGEAPAGGSERDEAAK